MDPYTGRASVQAQPPRRVPVYAYDAGSNRVDRVFAMDDHEVYAYDPGSSGVVRVIDLHMTANQFF